MYSPRPGTLSFKWEDDVPLEVKRARLHAIEAMQERIALESNAPFVGRNEEVLIESHQVAGGQHQWRGRTRTNKLVFLPATRPGARADDGGVAGDVKPGDLVMAHIDRATAWSLQGQRAIK